MNTTIAKASALYTGVVHKFLTLTTVGRCLRIVRSTKVAQEHVEAATCQVPRAPTKNVNMVSQRHPQAPPITSYPASQARQPRLNTFPLDTQAEAESKNPCCDESKRAHTRSTNHGTTTKTTDFEASARACSFARSPKASTTTTTYLKEGTLGTLGARNSNHVQQVAIRRCHRNTLHWITTNTLDQSGTMRAPMGRHRARGDAFQQRKRGQWNRKHVNAVARQPDKRCPRENHAVQLASVRRGTVNRQEHVHVHILHQPGACM